MSSATTANAGASTSSASNWRHHGGSPTRPTALVSNIVLTIRVRDSCAASAATMASSPTQRPIAPCASAAIPVTSPSARQVRNAKWQCPIVTKRRSVQPFLTASLRSAVARMFSYPSWPISKGSLLLLLFLLPLLLLLLLFLLLVDSLDC